MNGFTEREDRERRDHSYGTNYMAAEIQEAQARFVREHVWVIATCPNGHSQRLLVSREVDLSKPLDYQCMHFMEDVWQSCEEVGLRLEVSVEQFPSNTPAKKGDLFIQSESEVSL